MKTSRPWAGFAAAGLTLNFAHAAMDLPIDRTAAVPAIIDAAGRIGEDLKLAPVGCGSAGDNCRFDAGGAVHLSVTTLGGPRVYQLDASWNNDDKASSSASASRFQALCRSIVASVRPSWDRERVRKQTAKMLILRLIKEDHLDYEDRSTDIIFYGSRSVPDRPDFPTEAFVQCGVTANAENG